MDNFLPSNPAHQNLGNQNYLTRLFSGRLNRQNYILGSALFVLIPLICFFIVIFNILLSSSTFSMPYLDTTNLNGIVTPKLSIKSVLLTPANELWSLIGTLFFALSIPYLFSLQVRRLHDLNLSGWLWIVTFVPLFSLFALPLPGVSNPNQTWQVVANTLSLIASLFSLYVTLWPGTKGQNKYGLSPPNRSSFIKDILITG